MPRVLFTIYGLTPRGLRWRSLLSLLLLAASIACWMWGIAPLGYGLLGIVLYFCGDLCGDYGLRRSNTDIQRCAWILHRVGSCMAVIGLLVALAGLVGC